MNSTTWSLKTKGRVSNSDLAIDALKPKRHVPDSGKGPTNALLLPRCSVSDLCLQIQERYRQYACNLRSRIMLENRTRATVAVAAGYHAGMEEAERGRRFKEADATIKRILAGENELVSEWAVAGLVRASHLSIQQFGALVKAYAKNMEKLAKQLPVAEWVSQPEQHGFGFQVLAKIIGEAGSLSNYPNPAKLWRRMGCAPFASGDRVHQGSQWKKMNGRGLSSGEWEEYGYSPHRRSIVFQATEPLLKLNCRIPIAGDRRLATDDCCAGEESHEAETPFAGVGDVRADNSHENESELGPYYRRYAEAKATKLALESDEWPRIRCHRHGMLLCGKLLLKNLWIEWHRVCPSSLFTNGGTNVQQ